MKSLRHRQAGRKPPEDRRDPLWTTLSLLFFGLLPLALVLGFVIGAIGHHFAFDFHTFWEAARAVTRGESPYPTPAAIARAHPTAGNYEYFVYPPPFVLSMLPFAALPFAVASAIWTVALVACVAATLGVLDVRDWRCYGLAFATVPVLSSLRLGAVTPLLMLLAALAWRHRNNWLKTGAAVGCAIGIKLFLWPLVLWLVVSRRWRAAGFAIGGAVAVTMLAWATLGFDGFGDYPALLRTLSNVEGHQSYSLVAVAERLHFPDPSRSWLLLAIPLAFALGAGCIVRTRGNLDRASYTAAIGIALLLTPIVWLNYFALLLVPVALRRTTLGASWGLLALFWLAPSPEPTAHPLWQLLTVLALLTAISWADGLRRRERSSRPPSLVHCLKNSFTAADLGEDRVG